MGRITNEVILEHLVQLFCVNETEQTRFKRLADFVPNAQSFFLKFMILHAGAQSKVDWWYPSFAHSCDSHLHKVELHLLSVCCDLI